MEREAEIIECPSGCGSKVHTRATFCPNCGYRSESTNFEGLLGSLSTVSSILIGFGLAALVTLATDDSRAIEDVAVRITAGCWVVSSMMLLVVLVLTEIVRQRERNVGQLRISAGDEERIWKRCEILLYMFTLALVGTAVGVILLAFHFSVVHGVMGIVSVILSILVIIWLFR